MKRTRSMLTLVGTLLLLPLWCVADLVVTLRTAHVTYVAFEPVTVFVTILNDSSHPFTMDWADRENNATLFFEVQNMDSRRASRRLRPGTPVLPKLKLMPDEKRDLMIDLSRWHDFSLSGSYVVTAAMSVGGLVHKSSPVAFDTVDGIELEEVIRNVPGYDDLKRSYSLRYWAREGWEFLFLRVDEASSRLNYGVFQLGRLVRVFKPSIEVDRAGNVVVLHQNSVDCYTRSVFKSERNEVRFVDQTYHTEDGKAYDFSRKPRKGVGVLRRWPKE